MKKIDHILEKLLNKIYGSNSRIVTKLMANWAKIVGEEFSRNTYPYKIASHMERGKQVNTLYIRAKNSSISTTLSYSQGVILERIAICLGATTVNKLRVQIYYKYSVS